MLEQEQSLDVRMVLVGFRGKLREREARHDVRHDGKPVSVDFSAESLGVYLIDQGKNRVRVGVIDELVRKEPMQEGLNRGVGRRRIDQAGALRIHHVFVAKHVPVAQRAEALEADGGQARGLDTAKIPTTALHAEDRDLDTDVVDEGRLHRRVAAAVEHQRRILANQPRGVDAKRNVLVDLRIVPVAFDRRLRVCVGPPALHVGLPRSDCDMGGGTTLAPLHLWNCFRLCQLAPSA